MQICNAKHKSQVRPTCQSVRLPVSQSVGESVRHSVTERRRAEGVHIHTSNCPRRSVRFLCKRQKSHSQSHSHRQRSYCYAEYTQIQHLAHFVRTQMQPLHSASGRVQSDDDLQRSAQVPFAYIKPLVCEPIRRLGSVFSHSSNSSWTADQYLRPNNGNNNSNNNNSSSRQQQPTYLLLLLTLHYAECVEQWQR